MLGISPMWNVKRFEVRLVWARGYQLSFVTIFLTLFTYIEAVRQISSVLTRHH